MFCIIFSSDQPDSLAECISDDPEECGCSTISNNFFGSNPDRCNEHREEEQAVVECYGTISFSLLSYV